MLKATSLLFLVGVVSAMAQSAAKSVCPNATCAVPEPTAIPELILGVAAVFGYALWRHRKQLKHVNH
jgi:predicted transporter